MHKKDWGTASTISIGDKKLRLEIGKNGGKRIELYYNIDIWVENLLINSTGYLINKNYE